VVVLRLVLCATMIGRPLDRMSESAVVDIATNRNISRTRSFFNGYRIRYVPSVTIATGSVAQITLDCDSKMMALSPQADRRAATWLSGRHFYSLRNPSSRDAAKRRFRFLRRLRRQ
jgi:hypothetical protein